MSGADRVEASIGGYPGGFEVEATGDLLRYRDTERRLDATRVLSPAEWRSFWRAVDRLGVWTWERRYETPDVQDGTGWQVRLVHEGREFESEGVNGYPGSDDARTSEVFAAFCRAVGRLAGGRPFA
jgi:hypothetical protein